MKWTGIVAVVLVALWAGVVFIAIVSFREYGMGNRTLVLLVGLGGPLTIITLGLYVAKSMRHDEPFVEPVNIEGTGAKVSWYERHEAEVNSFWENQVVERGARAEFLVTALRQAILAADADRIYMLIDVALKLPDTEKATLLNEVLVIRGHRRHQEIVRHLQLLASPSSVPFLRQMLDEGIAHMVECSNSESGVVAKWFSHALFSIGTPEAIEVIRQFSAHSDEAVRQEMLYRLSKLSN
jgi:hypothetical protein